LALTAVNKIIKTLEPLKNLKTSRVPRPSSVIFSTIFESFS
jgi:hypothetical protein